MSLKTLGCRVCDAEDEAIAATLEEGEKMPKKYHTLEQVRDAIERLVSGEAYAEHQERLEEIEAREEFEKNNPRIARRSTQRNV